MDRPARAAARQFTSRGDRGRAPGNSALGSWTRPAGHRLLRSLDHLLGKSAADRIVDPGLAPLVAAKMESLRLAARINFGGHLRRTSAFRYAGVVAVVPAVSDTDC